MDKRDAKAMAEDSYKDLKIDVDFKDTCIDFGRFIIKRFPEAPMDVVEELWDKYQEYMTEEVFKVLNSDEPAKTVEELTGDKLSGTGTTTNVDTLTGGDISNGTVTSKGGYTATDNNGTFFLDEDGTKTYK